MSVNAVSSRKYCISSVFKVTGIVSIFYLNGDLTNSNSNFLAGYTVRRKMNR